MTQQQPAERSRRPRVPAAAGRGVRRPRAPLPARLRIAGRLRRSPRRGTATSTRSRRGSACCSRSALGVAPRARRPGGGRARRSRAGPPVRRPVAAPPGRAWSRSTPAQEWLEGIFASGHPGGLAGIFGHGGWWAVVLSALAALGVAAVLWSRLCRRPRRLTARRVAAAADGRPRPVCVPRTACFRRPAGAARRRLRRTCTARGAASQPSPRSGCAQARVPSRSERSSHASICRRRRCCRSARRRCRRVGREHHADTPPLPATR